MPSTGDRKEAARKSKERRPTAGALAIHEKELTQPCPISDLLKGKKALCLAPLKAHSL